MSKECRDINELHPKLQELAEQLVAECQSQGINLKLGETYRTVERQDYLYAQGRTREGKIVTNAKGSDMSSYHQWRLAFDVFINEKGNEYNSTLLKRAGAIGQKLGLEWGGSWKDFVDTPHYQYTFGLSIKDLKNGKKPPSYTKDFDLISAVEKLQIKGIIGNPEVWSNVDKINVNNVKPLITKFCNVMFEEDLEYIDAVIYLEYKKVISDCRLWKEFNNVTNDNVRSLLIKMSTLV